MNPSNCRLFPPQKWLHTLLTISSKFYQLLFLVSFLFIFLFVVLCGLFSRLFLTAAYHNSILLMSQNLQLPLSPVDAFVQNVCMLYVQLSHVRVLEVSTVWLRSEVSRRRYWQLIALVSRVLSCPNVMRKTCMKYLQMSRSALFFLPCLTWTDYLLMTGFF